MGFPGSRAACAAALALLTASSEIPPATPSRPAVNAPPAVWRSIPERAQQLRAVFESGLDRLDANLATLQQAPTLRSPTESKRVFRNARREYKHIEGLLEFYAPQLVVTLNSTETAEDDDQSPVDPTVLRGFPRIESALFSGPLPAAQRDTIRAEVTRMRTKLQSFRTVTSRLAVTEAQRFEIARTEIARVSTLGIAGFDATASGDGIVESAEALEGTSLLFTTSATRADQASIATLRSATAYLRAHPQFDRFDRFTFLTQYANAAAHAVGDARLASGERPLLLRRAWSLNASSVFDPGAIDARVYAPANAPVPTPTLVGLGRTLFFDPVLSGNGQRACASCHRPEQGFTDGLPRARPFADHVPLTRHTPSIVNAAYQPAQFADERVASIEQQIGMVLASPSEMHSSLNAAVAALRQSDEYQALFARAFGTKSGMTATQLQLALAAYVRSLSSMHSRFDRAIQFHGDTALLTTTERRGFNLFMGKARCGTCHFAPVFNGTAPPSYLSSEVEVVGVPAHSGTRNVVIDADSGRGAIDHVDIHMHAFKTPTVRNVTLAKTYMHNGVFHSLNEVLDFYNRGGGAGLGAKVPNATLSGDPLHLSERKKRDIIAFLGALVDTTGMTARPSRLPKFERSARYTNRAIGGLY